MPQITVLYAGLLGLFSLYLAIRTGSSRGKAGVSVGDGGDKDLVIAMRSHANFVEYVPLALIMIALLELNGVGATAIHALGAVLFVSRVAHGVGMRPGHASGPGRMIGATGTLVLTLVVSAWSIAIFFM